MSRAPVQAIEFWIGGGEGSFGSLAVPLGLFPRQTGWAHKQAVGLKSWGVCPRHRADTVKGEGMKA